MTAELFRPFEREAPTGAGLELGLSISCKKALCLVPGNLRTVDPTSSRARCVARALR
jgi:C4-dicarboxylate-specific signal transduction histidine kinase